MADYIGDVKCVNCSECGRFLPRDNWEIEYREMSTEIASVSGTCEICLSLIADGYEEVSNDVRNGTGADDKV